MGDASRSLNVLKKILNSQEKETPAKASSEKLIEKFFEPAPKITKNLKAPGRPKVEDHLKARNFTLCLAPKYLSFLDRLEVKDKKVQGRGRKIRFIIDRFLEMGQRQEAQLKVIRESLINVEQVLKGFSGQVKKGQKLELSPKEKLEVRKAVNQVHILVKVMAFSSKDLHRLLSRNEWAVMAFCLDWTRNQMDAK
ncbi:MAG: hypothetical protein NDI69_02955 [Bacteriovoracaceae bacterium]|nr:hypothetical protein [Bacteriovoracaceae bacterium]